MLQLHTQPDGVHYIVHKLFNYNKIFSNNL